MPEHIFAELWQSRITEHRKALDETADLKAQVEKIAEILAATAKERRHLFICGNGGSASDAIHWSGEWRGRFEKNRLPLKATALAADVGAITCIGNDYGYEEIFARQLKALAEKGDVLIAISTSGNSLNVIRAVSAAKEIGVATIGLLGKDGGKLADMVDYPLVIPAERTSHVQEMHEMIMHILCEYVDSELLNTK